MKIINDKNEVLHDNMKEIGGYIEFEHFHGFMLHEDGIKLNSGRHCLEYLIKARGIKHIALPFYLCDCVKEICEKNGVDCVFYSISKDFLPIFKQDRTDRYVYIVNYYGFLTPADIQRLKERYDNYIIIDNAQAYFNNPVEDTDTLYTCRKFFGVSDGGILFSNAHMSKEEEKGLEIDKSSSRLGFLYGRFEENASDYYSDYVLNNEIFKNEKMKIMSKITENTLKSIDYGFVRNRRNDNYQVLHKILGKYNELGVAETMDGAFAYPLLLKNGAEIRKALINRKIYVPVLWPDVFDNTKGNSIDYRYASDILPLPCDQRYSSDDMIIIADEIRHLI